MNALVKRLQDSMRGMPQATGLVTKHFWADGMYCRELYRPADTTIVGKVHKKEHLFIVASGTLLITNGDEATREVTGPAVFVCQPGTKRATYAVTDVTAITVHRCEFKDMQDIDNDLVEYDPEALFLPGNTLKALT
jgi:hypothetical protein